MYTFYKSIGPGTDQNTLYVSFGKSTPWSDNESEPGFAPPYPADNEDGVVDIWTNMMGAVKIESSMLDCVVPRRDWGDTRYPNPRTFLIGDIVVANSAPYNRTDAGFGYLVSPQSLLGTTQSSIDDSILTAPIIFVQISTTPSSLSAGYGGANPGSDSLSDHGVLLPNETYNVFWSVPGPIDL
jgi:hypothetical protein